jgi:uncharacterized protein (TIGR02996 family)
MSEEAAFIRAIVDGPGDDLPRLVYADWLDDRDDPRGAYLRAEAEWAKPWRDGKRPPEIAELQDRGATLDPVWVARISRAPLGVCFETTLFRRDIAPPATKEAIDTFAHEFGVVFPPEYRAFLLNYNGGWLATPGEAYFPEADETLGDVAGLAEFARRLFANCDESNRRCGLFPIGGTAGASGHNTLLGVGFVNAEPGKLYRGVYHAGWGEEPWTENGEFIEIENWDHKVADSLTELFAEWEQDAFDRADRD